MHEPCSLRGRSDVEPTGGAGGAVEAHQEHTHTLWRARSVPPWPTPSRRPPCAATTSPRACPTRRIGATPSAVERAAVLLRACRYPWLRAARACSRRSRATHPRTSASPPFHQRLRLAHQLTLRTERPNPRATTTFDRDSSNLKLAYLGFHPAQVRPEPSARLRHEALVLAAQNPDGVPFSESGAYGEPTLLSLRDALCVSPVLVRSALLCCVPLM